MHLQEPSEVMQVQKHQITVNNSAKECVIKCQIVLDLIRNKPVEEAAAILKHTPKAACEPLAKLLKSAIANAENNNNMDVTRLYVAECFVCQGPTLKRIRPRAQGRAFRINKKTSHITMVLKEAE